MNIKTYITICILFINASLCAQQDKPLGNEFSEVARDLVVAGNEYADEKAFAKAEVAYREAVALDPSNVAAKYNMGSTYYNEEMYEESMPRLLNAAEVAKTKKEKHKAYHNLGNALYQQKNFEGAVEAYKNALRNDPTDDETRYNLALAKKEQEKGGGGGGGDDENEDKDQNQDKEKNEKDNKGDGDEKESDDGEKKETDDKGEEEEKDGEDKQDEDGKPKDEEGDKEKEKPGDQGDEKKDKQPPQQKPGQGQLSPQQVKSLLEAMRNQEQKTQEKINARKVKGAKVKTEKDW